MAAPTSVDTTPPSPARSGRLLRFVLIALTLLPPLLVVRVIWRSTVDVPYWDQWELVALLDRSFEEWPSIGELFAPHNEHRIGFPRVVMLLLAHATAWDVRAELVLNVLVAAGTFCVLLAVARRTTAPLAPGGRLVPASLSTIFFSLAAWENWTWGWQLQIFMCVAAVVLAIALLGGRELGPVRFASALAMSVVATYSFGNGALVWPLGLVMIALRAEPVAARRVRAAVWSVASIVIIGLYLVDHHPRPAGQTPLELALYVPIYLGGPLVPADARGAAIVGALGLIALPTTVVALLRSRRLARPDLLAVSALAGYALASAIITSMSRAGLGRGQALSSRYTTIALLFWLALIVLLDALTRPRADGTGERSPRAARLCARAAIVAIVVLSLVASERGRVMARRHARELGPASQALRERKDEALLGRLYPHPALVRERALLLQRRRLSVFRDDR